MSNYLDYHNILFIDSAGKVGIGTENPANKLHIKNDTTDNTYALIENTTAGNAGISIKNSQGDWSIIANADLRFIDNAVGAGDRMRITSDGKVGIATTNPEVAVGGLHIFGTGARSGLRIGGGNDSATESRIYIDSNGDSSYLDSYGNGAHQKFQIETSELYLNVLGGRVGIGTSSPSSTLDIHDPSSNATTLTLGRSGEVPTIKAGGTNTDLRLEAVGTGGWMEFRTNNNTQMRILPNGNVGISTDNPSARLHTIPSGTIAGADLTKSGLLVGTTSLGIGIDDNEIVMKGGNLNINVGTNDDLVFKTNNTTRLTLQNDGELQAEAEIQSRQMIRATGWWNSTGGGFGSAAAEIGVSGGMAYLMHYNRSNSSYGPVQLQGTTINLNPIAGQAMYKNSEILSVGNSANLIGVAPLTSDGKLKQFTLDHINANGTQAREALIARLSIDTNDWSSIGTMEIEISERYYYGSRRKRYVVVFNPYNSGGSEANEQCQLWLMESEGTGRNDYDLRAHVYNTGSQQADGGYTRYADIYCRADHYSSVSVLIRYNGNYTTSTSPVTNHAWINLGSPSYTNISSFTADSDSSVHDKAYIHKTGGTFTGAIDVQNTLTVDKLVVDGSGDEKIELKGTDPYIRFVEGSTDKGYIQWSSSGNIYIKNQEDGSALRIRDTLDFSLDGSTFHKIWHAGNDGQSSGLDADKLDGYQATSFLRSDANDSASGSISFTNSYYEFGNGTGSVSNDGSWNGRINVAGTQHARIDVKSVSDGIITNMIAHTGHGAGKIGTWSNHPLHLMANQTSHATLTTAGSLSTTAQGTLWGSSNDGSGSGLDADKLDGFHIQGTTQNNEANKVVRTDNSGYLRTGWIETTSGARTVTTAPTRIYASDDSYLRYYTPQNLKPALGLPHNGFNRKSHTTNEKYYTGSYGWTSNYNANTTQWHLGSVPIDSWSSTTGNPDTGHWVGWQSVHAYNWGNVADTNYGVRIVAKGGETNPDVRVRMDWATTNGSWYRMFHDGYHPNADAWTTSRTLTLAGDATGSVSINGSSNMTLTVAVGNDSHTHDGRYYTESESNTRYLRRDDGNNVDIRLDSSNGRGLRFWDSDSYKIWMSSATDGTWGGRLDSTSDYNMYFKMAGGGTNRGYVFKTDSGNVLQIEGSGSIRSQGYVSGSRLYATSNRTSGYFFNDSGTRVSYTGGDFYIQSGVSNCYLYATNTYLGGSSGDNLYCRGNTISGTSWSMTGGGSLHCTEIDNSGETYTAGWFRNDTSGKGLYNQSTSQHFYSDDDDGWNIAGGTSANWLKFRDEHAGNVQGWLYADSGNNGGLTGASNKSSIGFLNTGGGWNIRSFTGDSYSPNLYFYEQDADSTWSGNVGSAGVGKIEYHSNRFYIEAAGDSNRIVQFRRNGTDLSYIDNNGKFMGSADTLDGINSSSFLRADTGDSVTSGYTRWYDNIEAYLGTGMDLKMYFDGSNTYFRSYPHSNGNIYFQGEDPTGVNHGLIYMYTNVSNESHVRMYYDGGERIRTTSGGINVGNPSATSGTEGGEIQLTTISGTSNYSIDTFKDTGNVYLHGSNQWLWRVFGSSAGTGHVLSFSWSDGSLRTTGDIVAYSSSDVRLKNNLKPIDNSLNRLLKLTGYSFTWDETRQSTYTGQDIGIVAQEIEREFPEVVRTNKHGYKSVRYEKLVPVLIESIKTQQSQLDEQQQQIDKLLKRVEQLER